MAEQEIDWLRKAIGKGLSGLVVLHLDGGPSAETVQYTAGVWYHVMKSWPIVWHEALDRPRLRDAFTALAGQANRWPAPADLRKLLPSRVYPQPALAEPEYPLDKQQRNLSAIKQLQALAGQRAALLRQLESADPATAADLRAAIDNIEQQQREVYSA